MQKGTQGKLKFDIPGFHSIFVRFQMCFHYYFCTSANRTEYSSADRALKGDWATYLQLALPKGS